MRVTRQSRFTGQWNIREIDITEEQLAQVDDPHRTTLIQRIVPDLTSSEREFLMTGMTDAEWASMGWGEE